MTKKPKKDECRCGKADKQRKSPYADGCGYNKDAMAAEFNGILINDAERSDKPCGNSYIPQNAKCHHGSVRGRAGQGAKIGAKVGAGLGALQGAAIGSVAGPGGALAGAAGGALGGAFSGAVHGGLIGGVVGHVEKSAARKQRFKAAEKKIAAKYKKAYKSGKAAGYSRKKMREMDMKYAMQIAKANDRVYKR